MRDKNKLPSHWAEFHERLHVAEDEAVRIRRHSQSFNARSDADVGDSI